MAPGDLQEVLSVLRPASAVVPEALLVGLGRADDAAVYRITPDLAIVETVDFFPPIVDDPYTWGAVAAANAMSDVYAMGGEVMFALAVAGFPREMPKAIISEVFRGGADKVAEAGGVIAGGHTVIDPEPKYGLCVTGRVHPDRLFVKGGLRPGDRLFLSKPLGTGVITTAAIKTFADLGCHLEQADPGFEDPEPIWATLFYAGIGARLSEYLPEWRDRIDPPLVRIIEEGQAISAFQLMQAAFCRTAIWDTVRRLFERHDLLLTPTVAVPPFVVGIEGPRDIATQGISRRGWFAFTFPFNLTGQPAATVPCGWTAEGLPIGLQIIGRRYDDITVLKAAAAFEAAMPWAERRPPLS